MAEMLDLFRLEEFLPLVVLCLILLFIAAKVTRPDAGVLKTSRWLAAVTFVVYLTLGICTWRPSNATEVLVTVLRACVAAGVIFSIATLALGIVATTIVDPFGRVKGWFQRMYAGAEDRMKQRKAEQERLERQRWEQLEEMRRQSQMERDRQRTADEVTRRERERLSHTDEARAEVIKFYDSHAAELAESLPAPLFRSKLETSFPEDVTPERAWQEAQSLISEMLPMIAATSERRRELQKQRSDVAKDIQRRRLEIRREETQLEQIIRSPTYDAEICEPEVNSREERIRDLQTELEILETELAEQNL